MNCKDIREFLPLYLGNELDQQQILEVKKHLDSCSECRSDLDELREVDNIIESHYKPATAPAFNLNKTTSKRRYYYLSYVAAAVLVFYIILLNTQSDKQNLIWDNHRITELIEMNDDLDVLDSDYARSVPILMFKDDTFYSTSEDVDYLLELKD